MIDSHSSLPFLCNRKILIVYNKYDDQRYLYILVAGALTCLQPIKAERVNENVNDTIKTYNIGEVIVTSFHKGNERPSYAFRELFSILSPQAIAARQIDALKDISAFHPQPFICRTTVSKMTFGHLYTWNRSAKQWAIHRIICRQRPLPG